MQIKEKQREIPNSRSTQLNFITFIHNQILVTSTIASTREVLRILSVFFSQEGRTILITKVERMLSTSGSCWTCGMLKVWHECNRSVQNQTLLRRIARVLRVRHVLLVRFLYCTKLFPNKYEFLGRYVHFPFKVIIVSYLMQAVDFAVTINALWCMLNYFQVKSTLNKFQFQPSKSMSLLYDESH